VSKKFNQQFACSRMMLPEHCGSLRKHAAAKIKAEEQRRPLIDEQLQEEQQQILEQALRGQKCLRFEVFTASGREHLSGVPRRLDENAGTILIDTGSNKLQMIRATAVIKLSGDC
jgi:hypothetical protein